MKANCVVCGKEFKKTWPNAKTCGGESCRKQVRKERSRRANEKWLARYRSDDEFRKHHIEKVQMYLATHPEYAAKVKEKGRVRRLHLRRAQLLYGMMMITKPPENPSDETPRSDRP